MASSHAMPSTVKVEATAQSASAAGAKVIVVARNAKDTAVSMLHHTANIPPFGWRRANWRAEGVAGQRLVLRLKIASPLLVGLAQLGVH